MPAGGEGETVGSASRSRLSLSRGDYTDCRPTTAPLVFDGAYSVSLCYETTEGVVGEAKGGIWASSQSGLLWFFSRGNAEVLVKVLDGCSHNGSRWIFVAPVTDVAFNLHVTSVGGREWTHRNRLGETAATASDTSAFDCAADDGVLETVSVSSASAEEGDAVEFIVTQSGPAASDTVLGWSTADGTAASGADFGAVTAGTLTIPAGETTGALSVSTVEDALPEENETFTVTLTGTTLPPGVTLGTVTATGTIVDDDRGPRVTGAIPARTVMVGRPVAVDPYFSDPDGDALIYAAESSNPAVASVRVEGSIVSVTALASGAAAIAVTASDPGGSSARQASTSRRETGPCPRS